MGAAAMLTLSEMHAIALHADARVFFCCCIQNPCSQMTVQLNEMQRIWQQLVSLQAQALAYFET